MRIIALCLRLAVKTAFAFCGLIGIVEEAAAEGPGSIIRVWPLEGGGPGNSEAFRILYRSTGLNGEPIEVSGAIHFPSSPAPAGGRHVIAWAHPTSGVVTACAPTLMPDNSGMIWGLPDMPPCLQRCSPNWARPHVAQRGQPHLRGERQRKTDARLDRRPLQRRARAVEPPLGPWPANS